MKSELPFPVSCLLVSSHLSLYVTICFAYKESFTTQASATHLAKNFGTIESMVCVIKFSILKSVEENSDSLNDFFKGHKGMTAPLT